MKKSLSITVEDVKGKTIAGTAAANILTGAAENDKLSGLAGNGTIKAGLGADTITGGRGFDTLFGGADHQSDTFVFDRGDSGATAKTLDKIYDFVADTDRKPGTHMKGADIIDLRHIDADPLKGDQALRFVDSFKKP